MRAQIEVQLTRQRNSGGKLTRGARKGVLNVRFMPVTLPPPTNDPREDDLPDGVDESQRIDWMLLTSEPVESIEDALRIIGYYRKRWIIEEWHRVLKEGCKLEGSQLDEAADIERLAAIQGVVAVRLLQLRDAAGEAHASDDPKLLREIVPTTWRQVGGWWGGGAVDGA